MCEPGFRGLRTYADLSRIIPVQKSMWSGSLAKGSWNSRWDTNLGWMRVTVSSGPTNAQDWGNMLRGGLEVEADTRWIEKHGLTLGGQ